MRHILILLSFLLLFSFTFISCKKSTDSTTTSSWTKQLGTSDNDSGESVTTDSSGNIYVTGTTQGGLDGNTNSGNLDIFLVKYDSSGTKQ